MKALNFLLALLTASFLTIPAFGGTSGKITGTVKDGKTGEPLVNANVLIVGTNLGASTNVDGYYVILNVPSGTYRMKASLVGYTSTTLIDVRVDIDQTTISDIKLVEESVQAQEVVVVATRPVVQRDVAASRANIQIEEVSKLPVTTVTDAVGLQAGIQGLSVRGGFANETAFMIDGNVMRDERTAAPMTSISLLAVENIQVQTGGFNAEYGNVRSGIINATTKEGGTSRYTVGFMGRYSGAQPKHFGSSIYDKNSYWMRPYLEAPVSWLGTQAVDPTTGQPYWDRFTQMQYPSFEGWNSVAQKSFASSMQLTPQALQHLFEFQRRKIAEVNQGDYDVDASVGGPLLPTIGEKFGDLRFFAAFHKTQNMYLVPLSDDAWRDWNGSLKVTADITKSMKLTGELVQGRTTGTNNNNAGNPGMFQSPEDIGSVMNRVSYIDTRIFATDYWAPTTVNYYTLMARLSNVINEKTYFDASISQTWNKYDTNPGKGRDTSRVYRFGDNYYVNEAPFGFDSLPDPANGLADIRYGVGFSNSRDSSRIMSYTGKFDITSQFDRFNQVKGGVEFTYTDQYIAYGLYDAKLKDATYANSYHRFPIRGAAYVQDKLEFEGMVANLGVRVTYLNPQGDWYDYTPYSQAFSGNYSAGIDTILVKTKVEKQLVVSPRLGISFPISEYAKLYFNYGHFLQQPTPDNMYLLRQSGFDKSIQRVANPNILMPRTVQYELGYEHSIADEYLLRVAAYYKDISHETQLVEFTNKNGSVDYLQYTNSAYRDIRGFEITAQKNRGNWVQGFVNYTYDVRSSGYFGYPQYFQNPLDQLKSTLLNIPQSKPIPQPYARANLDFFTPSEFGPSVGGISLAGNWRVNLLGSWSAGYYFTWTGGAGIPGVVNNVQWSDYWNINMRITKTIPLGRLNLEFFADITNLFNYKYMTTYGFVTAADYNSYMQSLHLPAFPSDVDVQIGYVNIPGTDHPGDYRKEGVDWQPVLAYRTYASLPTAGEGRPFYFAADQGRYYQWINNAYQPVDPGKVQQVLDDKAYIDMPNMDTFSFLNPRRVFFGLRMWFDI